jgi:hypothetical protein
MKNEVEHEVSEDFINEKVEEMQYVLDYQIYNQLKNAYNLSLQQDKKQSYPSQSNDSSIGCFTSFKGRPSNPEGSTNMSQM